MTKWTQLGPREREILAVLRCVDDAPTTREIQAAVRERGDKVAYTTIKRTVERLVEKGLVEREPELYRGTERHRYRYDVADARPRFVRECADELRSVLGESAVEELVTAVRTTPAPNGAADDTRSDTHDNDN